MRNSLCNYSILNIIYQFGNIQTNNYYNSSARICKFENVLVIADSVKAEYCFVYKNKWSSACYFDTCDVAFELN